MDRAANYGHLDVVEYIRSIKN